MRVDVIIEPQYRQALWCRQTLAGMEEACAQKKYTLRTEALEAVLAADGKKELVVVVGTSRSWVPGALSALKDKGTRAVLVSYLDACSYEAAATVTMAHGSALTQAMRYLAHWGRPHTALYGMNPDSSADRVKCDTFGRLGGAAEAVFLNTGSLQQCADAFFPQAARYDSVILANDIVAVSFLRQARMRQVDIPRDLYAVSFGGCQIGRRTHPTLTSMALRHETLGRQAVSAFSYLLRQEAGVRLDLSVPASFGPGESTAMRPPPPEAMDSGTPPSAPVDFYRDPESDAILRLEALYSRADDTDTALLEGLIRGRRMEAMAEACHVSLGTVKYRLRRMLESSGLQSRDDLRGLILRYLGTEPEDR